MTSIIAILESHLDPQERILWFVLAKYSALTSEIADHLGVSDEDAWSMCTDMVLNGMLLRDEGVEGIFWRLPDG